MHRELRKLPRTGLALALFLGAAAADGLPREDRRAPPEDGSRDYREEIVVREIEVDVDLSSLPPLESLGKRGDDDFLVLEDGAALDRARPARSADATGATAAGPAIDEILIWLDPGLASPRALAAAVRALVDSAPALAGAGHFEARIAGDVPRTAPPGDATAIAAALSGLSRRWSGRTEAAPSLVDRLRAVDRLTVDLVRRGGGGRRVLLIAADGWPVDAVQLQALADLEAGRSSPATHGLSPIEDCARIAAAYGWTVFAVVARRTPTPDASPRAAREQERSQGGSSKGRPFVLFRFPFERRRPPAREAARLDLATDFGLRPLAHLVRASAGSLVGGPGDIATHLDRVAHRRRFVVRAPDRPPGELQRIEVRWSGGDGRPLPARRWIRSGLPAEASLARLRTLAAGDLSPAEGQPVEIDPASGRVCFRDDRPHPGLRRSAVTVRGGEISTRIGAVVRSGTACVTPSADPAESGDRADRGWILLEDAESGAWGAASSEAMTPAPPS